MDWLDYMIDSNYCSKALNEIKLNFTFGQMRSVGTHFV